MHALRAPPGAHSARAAAAKARLLLAPWRGLRTTHRVRASPPAAQADLYEIELSKFKTVDNPRAAAEAAMRGPAADANHGPKTAKRPRE